MTLHSTFIIILLLIILLFFFTTTSSFDPENLQDTCPTSLQPATVFINGFPCKNPSTITAADFKSSKLSTAGEMDSRYSSSVKMETASDYPGLNTLGLSISRTDLDVDGIVMLHSHPRGSEMLFVEKGIVLSGFIDTKNHLFQSVLNEGDVMVIPKGLLHFYLNYGYEVATVFSVLNSQNPGVVTIAGAMFLGLKTPDLVMDRLMQSLSSTSKMKYHNGNSSDTNLI